MTSVITGAVAIIPPSALGYLEKLASVLLLAVVAEVGRRVVAIVWKDKSNKEDH